MSSPPFLADQGNTVGMSSLGNKVLIREGVVYGEEEIGAGGKGELVVWLMRMV